MGDVYLFDLADQLRLDPWPVIELDGWQYRARSSGGYDGDPWCVMWHHTASAGDGADDADYCTHRSPDAPLCNIVIGRDGTRYVCAGGATNTNGKGGPLTLPDGRTVPADTMNTRAVGIEISNGGTGMPYPQAQIDSVFATSIAITRAYIGGPDQLAQHVDWAPGRKIDPATAAAVDGPWQPRSINGSGSWDLDDLRAEALARAAPTPAPTPTPEDDDMPKYIYAFTNYANTWTEYGVHLSPETYSALVAGGAQVIVSAPQEGNAHLNSLLQISGLNTDYLVPK